MSSKRKKQKKQMNMRHTVRQYLIDKFSFWYKYFSAASRISKVMGFARLIVLSRHSLRLIPISVNFLD